MCRIDCKEIAASAQQVLQHLLHLTKRGLCEFFYNCRALRTRFRLSWFPAFVPFLANFTRGGVGAFSKPIRFHWKLAGLRTCQPL